MLTTLDPASDFSSSSSSTCWVGKRFLGTAPASPSASPSASAGFSVKARMSPKESSRGSSGVSRRAERTGGRLLNLVKQACMPVSGSRSKVASCERAGDGRSKGGRRLGMSMRMRMMERWSPGRMNWATKMDWKLMGGGGGVSERGWAGRAGRWTLWKGGQKDSKWSPAAASGSQWPAIVAVGDLAAGFSLVLGWNWDKTGTGAAFGESVESQVGTYLSTYLCT